MLTKAAGIWTKNSNIVKYIFTISNNWFAFKFVFNIIILVMQSWIFHSSVSHDPSEIILICWFAVQENYCQYWKQLLNIFVETQIFFTILWWIEISKDQHCFVIRIFCNIIVVFNVTFDQFNASLLNKSNFSLAPGKNLTANFWTVVHVSGAASYSTAAACRAQYEQTTSYGTSPDMLVFPLEQAQYTVWC